MKTREEIGEMLRLVPNGLNSLADPVKATKEILMIALAIVAVLLIIPWVFIGIIHYWDYCGRFIP